MEAQGTIKQENGDSEEQVCGEIQDLECNFKLAKYQVPVVYQNKEIKNRKIHMSEVFTLEF